MFKILTESSKQSKWSECGLSNFAGKAEKQTDSYDISVQRTVSNGNEHYYFKQSYSRFHNGTLIVLYIVMIMQGIGHQGTKL